MSTNVDASEDERMSDERMSCTSPEPCEESEISVHNLLPDKSKGAYELSYNRFVKWQKHHNSTSFSQKVLKIYFSGLCKKWKSSTLWSEYSKLARMLKIKHNVDMGDYNELKALLKKTSVGYRAKKSETFTAKDFEQYLHEAPDYTCLAIKVAMIFGILGACRKEVLLKLETTHLKTYYEPEDTDNKHPMLLVRLLDTKTNQEREFTIKGKLYEYYQRYSNLRPERTFHKRFFINYQKGKCTDQPIGEKKFSSFPRQVAEFLKLPNPKMYTGNAFRRTSAALLAGRGTDIATLKRHGGWKSTPVAEGYVESWLESEEENGGQIRGSIQLNPSSSNEANSSSGSLPNNRTIDINLPTKLETNSSENDSSEPSWNLVSSDGRITLNISGCTNCTFNIIEKP